MASVISRAHEGYFYRQLTPDIGNYWDKGRNQSPPPPLHFIQNFFFVAVQYFVARTLYISTVCFNQCLCFCRVDHRLDNVVSSQSQFLSALNSYVIPDSVTFQDWSLVIFKEGQGLYVKTFAGMFVFFPNPLETRHGQGF